MRTTVRFDPELFRLLKEEADRKEESFTKALNRVLRAGLIAKQPAAREPYRVKPVDTAFREGVDPHKLKDFLLDEDTENFGT